MLIFRQILLTSFIRNVWRSVKRICMFISGLKGLICTGSVTKDARLSLDFLVNSNIFVTLNKISVIMLQNRWKTAQNDSF